MAKAKKVQTIKIPIPLRDACVKAAKAIGPVVQSEPDYPDFSELRALPESLDFVVGREDGIIHRLLSNKDEPPETADAPEDVKIAIEVAQDDVEDRIMEIESAISDLTTILKRLNAVDDALSEATRWIEKTFK